MRGADLHSPHVSPWIIAKKKQTFNLSTLFKNSSDSHPAYCRRVKIVPYLPPVLRIRVSSEFVSISPTSSPIVVLGKQVTQFLYTFQEPRWLSCCRLRDGLPAWRQGFESQKRQVIFYFPQRPDRLWGLSRLLPNGYWGRCFLPGIKRPGRESNHSPPSSV
jgi:hypothetical protein